MLLSNASKKLIYNTSVVFIELRECRNILNVAISINYLIYFSQLLCATD